LKEKTKKTERLKRHKKSVGGRLKLMLKSHQLQNEHHRRWLSHRKRLCVLGVQKITTKNGFSAACAHLGGMKCVPIMKATEHLYVIIVKDLP
jgi:hypothetical protein